VIFISRLKTFNFPQSNQQCSAFVTFTTNLRHDGLLFYIIILNSKLFTQNVTTWRRLDAYPATTAQHQIQFSNKNINYSCLPHKFQIIYRNSVLIFCSIIMPLFKYMNFRYRCTIIGPTTIFRRRPNVAFSWLSLPHYRVAGPTKFCRSWANASCYWGTRAMKILIICNVLSGCRLHLCAFRIILGNSLILTTLALGNIIVLKARSHTRRINSWFTHAYVGWIGKSCDGTGWLHTL
jgi:hypothetical protein